MEFIKTLVVEDNLSIRNLLKHILEENGFKVDAPFKNLSEVEKLIYLNEGKYNFLLCDTKIWDSNGYIPYENTLGIDYVAPLFNTYNPDGLICGMSADEKNRDLWIENGYGFSLKGNSLFSNDLVNLYKK